MVACSARVMRSPGGRSIGGWIGEEQRSAGFDPHQPIPSGPSVSVAVPYKLLTVARCCGSMYDAQQGLVR
jgi:hypothetical protein